jgi:hypothetical protein
MASKKDDPQKARAAHQEEQRRRVAQNNAKLAKQHPDNPALRPASKPKKAKADSDD